MELQEVKNFLRIDADLTDDDAQLTAMISAAKSYIYRCTGVIYDNSPLYDMTVKLLVSHFYTHRTQDSKNSGDYSHSITDLINLIEVTGGAGND